MAIFRHVVLKILNIAKKQFKGIGVKTLRKIQAGVTKIFD